MPAHFHHHRHHDRDRPAHVDPTAWRAASRDVVPAGASDPSDQTLRLRAPADTPFAHLRLALDAAHACGIRRVIVRVDDVPSA